MRILSIAVCLAAFAAPVLAADKPDVLLIAVDDLNDWVGVLGGHPDAKTPNMDRLAKRGVVFTNAHCQSPVCNPSRASMMTSLYPETTGIYFLNPDLSQSPVAKKATLMPARFVAEGYHVSGAGKLFHGGQNNKYLPNYGGGFGGMGPRPKKKLTTFPGHPLWDWGVYPDDDAKMPDHMIASWAVKQLGKKSDKPTFTAVGFYRPHVPQYAPQKWFDMHNKSHRLPDVKKDDLADLSKYAIDLTREKHVAPTHDWVVDNDEWTPLVHSYLASVSFADAQVGRVLDALDASGKADNTIVVLYSDHGFHLGEKERWAKRSIWDDGVRVPIIVAPGSATTSNLPGFKPGQVCTKPVELIDIYPTLLDLTGAKPDPAHEGQSLAPLLRDVNADWPHMARSSFGPGNVAIRSERYRYIRYADGSEELYDHKTDPHEWTNLIGQADRTDLSIVVASLRQHLPKKFHPILGAGSTGHKAFEAAGAAQK